MEALAGRRNVVFLEDVHSLENNLNQMLPQVIKLKPKALFMVFRDPCAVELEHRKGTTKVYKCHKPTG